MVNTKRGINNLQNLGIGGRKPGVMSKPSVKPVQKSVVSVIKKTSTSRNGPQLLANSRKAMMSR